MLYLRPEGFNVPTAGPKVTDEDWRRTFQLDCEHEMDQAGEYCTCCGRSAKRIEKMRQTRD